MEDVEKKDLIIASDIFKAMTKTLKTFKAYLPNNPIYQKFAAELLEKFNFSFEIFLSWPTYHAMSLSC